MFALCKLANCLRSGLLPLSAAAPSVFVSAGSNVTEEADDEEEADTVPSAKKRKFKISHYHLARVFCSNDGFNLIHVLIVDAVIYCRHRHCSICFSLDDLRY